MREGILSRFKRTRSKQLQAAYLPCGILQSIFLPAQISEAQKFVLLNTINQSHNELFVERSILIGGSLHKASHRSLILIPQMVGAEAASIMLQADTVAAVIKNTIAKVKRSHNLFTMA